MLICNERPITVWSKNVLYNKQLQHFIGYRCCCCKNYDFTMNYIHFCMYDESSKGLSYLPFYNLRDLHLHCNLFHDNTSALVYKVRSENSIRIDISSCHPTESTCRLVNRAYNPSLRRSSL